MGSQAFLERYRQLASIEQSKNELIEELLHRITELEEGYKRAKLDNERETRFNRDIQLHEMELMDQISRIKTIMNREPFVIILLDGDSVMFKDEFLQGGEQGGQRAAGQLYTALEDYLAGNFPTLVSPKIMCKLYVNLKGLGDACARAGIISDFSLLEDFVRGFNSSNPLFDMVDVESQSVAQHKIGEIFKLHLYNCHCHQIFLGCSSDGEYHRILKDTLVDRDLKGRVSLIEGIPFERDVELIKSSFRFTDFPELFRSTRISATWTPWSATVTTRPHTAASSPSRYTRSPLHNSTVTGQQSNNNLAVNQDFQSIRSATRPSTDTVERNKYGQRVDRVDFKAVPREELNRIKKLKLCNFYFLQGECPNDNCHHDHSRKLAKSELITLKAIARMTPCRFGLECDDPDCMYGHRCPQSEPGKKDCFWGPNCRFDSAAHGIDTNIVKVTRI